MKKEDGQSLRCAIYTRVSTDAGLEQDFNSLDAQREASEAYIKSQTHEGWKLVRTAYNDGGYSGGSLTRPALQKLLEDIKAGLIDVVLVYKVDRLTRSLADFAKMVELFDTHGVSFVSVTQAFNTTSSMGRLTLNVLLSFAQFEREVTGERIRDKIAASKRKGIWMGGTPPLGYHVDNRKLVIDSEEAAIVKMIFERYLELGSIRPLIAELNDRGIRTRLRQISSGPAGGVRFTTGPLAHLLRNRTYLGETVHKGQYYPGEHPALLDKILFEAVQARLTDNAQVHRRTRESSGAILVGRIFDDRGNTMTPTYSVKGGLRYRYYVSRVCTEGRKNDRGTIHRVPAHEVESRILEKLRAIKATNDADTSDAAMTAKIKRVKIEPGRIAIELLAPTSGVAVSPIHIPWSPRPGRARREIVLPHTDPTKDQRPDRNEYRDTLLRRVAKGRSWLKELMTGDGATVEMIAAREGRSNRSVQMMLSLAFVAPDIIEASVRGALPRGIGITRLMDLPPLWSDQYQKLGLKA
jgi:site-specific DNA recombinase